MLVWDDIALKAPYSRTPPGLGAGEGDSITGGKHPEIRYVYPFFFRAPALL
jgi:hypothetical protein